MPYHPLLAVLLPLLPVAWLLASMPGLTGIAIEDPQWPMFLIVGALLGVPMSIPVLAWGLMVFRGPLVQALFFLAGIIMVVIDWYAGRTGAFWLILPVLYGLVWAAQFGAGHLRLRELQAERRQYEPVNASDAAVWIQDHSRDNSIALIRQDRARSVYNAGPYHDGRGRVFERISAEEHEVITDKGARKPPKGWMVHSGNEMLVLERPSDPPPAPPIQLYREPEPGYLGVASPDLYTWVVVCGEEARRRPVGRFSLVTAPPLATLFHWTSLLAKSEWVVGFMRRPVALDHGPTTGVHDLLEPLEPQTPAGVRDHIADALYEATREDRQRAEAKRVEDKARRRKSNITPRYRLVMQADGTTIRGETHGPTDRPSFWREVLEDPGEWTRHAIVLGELVEEAHEATREDLRRALDWLELALRKRDRDSARAAGQYLAEMPAPLLASDYARVRELLNSRIVGMEWRITPKLDMSNLPPNIPRWDNKAGFGLIRYVPDLYLKVADLGPDMPAIVAGLVQEASEQSIGLPADLRAVAEEGA